MSVLSLNMIENILIEQGAVSPAHILDELNKELSETLNKDADRPVSKFGLDVGLVSIEKSSDEVFILEFAGAHHPLLINKAGQLTEIKGDKIFPGMSKEKFRLHHMEIRKGDMIYLFTDGAGDQFGGEKREKLFSSRFREWITDRGGRCRRSQCNRREPRRP